MVYIEKMNVIDKVLIKTRNVVQMSSSYWHLLVNIAKTSK